MKITVEIDCTPAEAREMLGLPEVRGIQEKWMKKVESKLMEDVEKFSPENIMKSWVSGASSNMDWLPGMLAAFGQPGAGGKTGKK